MRFGISGTHSAGKTTLLNALRSEKQFKDYQICNEVTRWVKSLDIDINEGGSDKSQLLVMMKHIYNIYMFDKFITDRTSLDGYVYSQWLYAEDKISIETLDLVRSIFYKTIEEYDAIFYIAPEFDLEDDGVRSTDVSFRDEIHQLFETIIDQEQIPVYKLTGSVRERTQQVLDIINKEK